jgi:hypothetical protein
VAAFWVAAGGSALVVSLFDPPPPACGGRRLGRQRAGTNACAGRRIDATRVGGRCPDGPSCATPRAPQVRPRLGRFPPPTQPPSGMASFTLEFSCLAIFTGQDERTKVLTYDQTYSDFTPSIVGELNEAGERMGSIKYTMNMTVILKRPIEENWQYTTRMFPSDKTKITQHFSTEFLAIK